MSAFMPGVAVEPDPARVVAELGRRFPGISAWWGEATGEWWAVVSDRSGRDRLVEAASPAELSRRLEAALGPRVPRFTRTALQTGTPRAMPGPSRSSHPVAPSRPSANAGHGRHEVPRRSVGRRVLDVLSGRADR